MPWTEITRREYWRGKVRYASDLTDAEWALIASFFPEPRRFGRPRTTDLRAVIEAFLYISSTGCQWRMLPKCFPPYSTVQRFFYEWRADGLWEQIKHELVMRVREVEGRQASPSAGVIDSQSVKTTEPGGPRGYDAGKKIKGRKRHILTDTTGLLVAAMVHEANIQDPRWGRAIVDVDPRDLALAAPCFRRWWLFRQQTRRRAGQGRQVDTRDRQTIRYC